MGKQWKQWQTFFLGAPKLLQMVTAAMKLKDAPWKKSYDKHRQRIKKQRHYFANKGRSSQSYGFSSSYAWMWEFDYKESWALKNWWFQAVVLEKTLESPLDCKEIKPVNPKEINPEYSLEGLKLMLKLKLRYFSHLWEEPTHWKRPWFSKRLRTSRAGGNRGWDGWMASRTHWTWAWANSGRWWRTGKPAVVQSMGFQWVRYDWATEQQQVCKTLHDIGLTRS